MRHIAWCLLVVLGCSKKSEPGVVDAGAPPKAVVPAAVERPVPTSPTTLSLFEPADGQCAWRFEDPVAKQRVVIATFPGTCVGARVAWNVEGSRAVVWFDPQWVASAGYFSQTSTAPARPDEKVDETAKPRFFLVDTRAGTTEALTMPTVPQAELKDLGLSPKSEVLALFEERLPDDAKGKVKSGGEEFDLDSISEGLPVLVHAYRREGAGWTRIETKLSTTGWDYARGVDELDAAGTLGRRSAELLTSHAQGDAATEAELAKLKKFMPKKATAEDGEWIFLGVGGTRVYVWEVTGEFAHTTGLVVAHDAPLAELGFTDGDLVALRVSEKYLLVSSSGAGTHPRLYEFPSGKLVFKSDAARAVTFWPTTVKVELH